MGVCAAPCVLAEDGKLEQVVRDTARVAAEQVKGLSTQASAGAGPKTQHRIPAGLS